jgi:hypothetical protein
MGRMPSKTSRVMAGRGELWELVRRHPFISRETLEALHGEDLIQAMVEESRRWLKVVEVKGLGACYADQEEPMASLMDVRRAELARRFGLRAMGKGALFASLAPGFEADGEFFWMDHWWRVWVDPGGCAPEALRFVQTPPREFGPEVRDLILTVDGSRLDSLASQVELRWGGGRKVHVMHATSDRHRVARPGTKATSTRVWKPYRREDVEACVRSRQRGARKRSLLAGVAMDLDEKDWGLLVEAGNIPMMTRYELAYLQTDDVAEMKEALERLGALERAGLLETAKSVIAQDRLENRKVLTSMGLELLAAHWGTTITNMVRMHPWPQIVDRETGRPRYGLAWLGNFGDHYRLVRQFGLALVSGARCVSNAMGEVEARLVTTIGSRLLYRTRKEKGRGNRAGVVMPDGLVWARITQRGWIDGVVSAPKPVCEHTLWLEVDRSTMSLARVAEKLDGYARIWASLKSSKPVLVWVIEGLPSREVRVLAMMKERGIDGWAATLERLRLPKDDAWWLVNAAAAGGAGRARVGVSHESVGGMAPWREIWKAVDDPQEKPLLGHQPWRKRELRRSPPGKGEQEWVRHKVV